MSTEPEAHPAPPADGIGRIDWITAGLVVVFVARRLWATLGRPIVIFPDSASYFELRLWGGVRFPVVTTLYSVIGDHRAIVTVQAMFAAGCWAAAAVIGGSIIRGRAPRIGFQAGVLLLGLTTPVMVYDNALLSESVSISLVVLLTALALRLMCRVTRGNAIAVAVVGACWAMSRQSNAMVILVVAIGLAALAVGAHLSVKQTESRAESRADGPTESSTSSRSSAGALAGALAIGFGALGILGLALASSNRQIEEYNTAQILVSRILTDDDRAAWFEGQGMPRTGPDIVAGASGDQAVALQHDPAFGRWLADEGPSTYLRYLVSHPGDAVTIPFTGGAALRAVLMGTTYYGNARQALPDALETFFWPQSDDERSTVVLVVVTVLAIVVGVALADPSRRRGAVAGFVILLVCGVNLVLVTYAAAWEYERLLVGSGVAARVAVMWLVASTLGGIVRVGEGVGPAREPAGPVDTDPAEVDVEARR
ncbi:MAG: hypothetical protein AMXMBFR46_22180 [Acidimicrobiia bacterium]